MRITPSLLCFYSLFGVMSFVNKGHSQPFDWSVQSDKNCGSGNLCPTEPDNGCGVNQVVVGTAGTPFCHGIIDTTIDDCKAACEQKPECAGFNWHKRTVTYQNNPPQSCYLQLSTTCGTSDLAEWDCYEKTQLASGNGDPHFVTWWGRKFDFHGVCDLVLLQNPGFQQGLGLDIHVRTKQLKQFLYISSAVLQIGDKSLEVMGSVHKNLYWINKQQSKNTNKGIVGEINGNNIEYWQVNSKQHEFVVNLKGGALITMRMYKNFVYVGINGAAKSMFGSSHGLVGAYDTTLLELRDGSKIFEDVDKFGQHNLVSVLLSGLL